MLLEELLFITLKDPCQNKVLTFPVIWDGQICSSIDCKLTQDKKSGPKKIAEGSSITTSEIIREMMCFMS